jgi:2'-hydroxyisoflavone reductase
MNVLVLGGTRFLGRHLVEILVAAGHRVTTFNRGVSSPDLFAAVERLHGDRDGGLDALRARRWDVAFDTCGYLPRVVRQSVQRLGEAVGRYVFVSSISVYADFSRPGLDEDAATATLPDPHSEDIAAHYGALKAACEEVVVQGFGRRALIVRPGLIVGPYDPTGRFTYWPLRIARGGEVLAPGDPAAPTQYIDVRDLAAWMVALAQRGVGGVFNATGPARPLSLGDLLQSCVDTAGASARLEWVDAAFLRRNAVAEWTELPLWVPQDMAGLTQVAITRALGAGLSLRPVAHTVRDTLQWARDAGGARPPVTAGLDAAREAHLLAAWRTARGSALPRAGGSTAP